MLASKNPKKLTELQDSLSNSLDGSLEIVAATEFDIASPDETGTTFVENAIIKARHACRITGLCAIADDSGLEVDYLKGKPGVYSSRYAGEAASDEDNNNKLLAELKTAPSARRTARFRCVIVLMRHEQDPMPLVASGTWEGLILTRCQGANGFGYDPLFLIPSLGISSAELDPAEKNRISHRGYAIAQLKQLLVDWK